MYTHTHTLSTSLCVLVAGASKACDSGNVPCTTGDPRAAPGTSADPESTPGVTGDPGASPSGTGDLRAGLTCDNARSRHSSGHPSLVASLSGTSG